MAIDAQFSIVCKERDSQESVPCSGCACAVDCRKKVCSEESYDSVEYVAKCGLTEMVSMDIVKSKDTMTNVLVEGNDSTVSMCTAEVPA